MNMTVPMSDELREAVRRLRPILGARTDAAAVRIAIAALCRARGIEVAGSKAHPDPDDQPAPTGLGARKRGGSGHA